MIFGLFKRFLTKKPKWSQISELDIQATPRPITTAAASLKAYKELLDKAGYFVGDREMRAMAATDFKDDIREHGDKLKLNLEAATDEHQDLSDQCSMWAEELEEAQEEGQPTQAALDRLKAGQTALERARQELARAKAEREDFNRDRTAFIVALANHNIHGTPDPRAQRRD